jgi:hypothetical protein
MLYLKPPFNIISGAAVFADHADPLQFYFLPSMPELTSTVDPVTGVKVPHIDLIKFRGSAGNGGFLTFEVSLGPDQSVVDDIAAELRTIYHLRDTPRVAPVLLEGGSVRLVILGRATDDHDGQPMWDSEQEQRFKVRFAPESKPALYGDNRAIFSVELDQYSVELIENSLLHAELMPIGVVYSLDFLALRPAFTVKVTADWDRVQTHFDESFKAEVLFSSVEIDKVVDKLIEDQVVNIEVDSFLPEGEDDGGSWVGRRDHAVNEFKDMVLQNFFKPSLEPVKEEQDGWDRFSNTAERLSTLAVTGGWAGVAKFSYVKRDLTRIDQKRINLNMQERVTVRRSIYPQASLKGLWRLLRDAQVDFNRFVQSVTLDDPWFEKRSLKAHSLVAFDNDKVESVNVTLTYDGEPRTIRLSKATPDGASDWNSVISGNGAGTAMVRGVDYEYRVSFGNVDTAERPGVLLATTQTTIGDEFDISPRGEGLYFLDDIQIGSSVLPWDRYPQVSVDVRYSDTPNGIRLAESFVLTKDSPEVTWQRFRLDPTLDHYDVRVTFLAADHRDVQVDWTTIDQERLIIRDPHPLRRSVQVAPAVDWRLVAMIFVELRYVDTVNGIDEEQTLAFFDTDDDRIPKPFSVNLVDGTNRLVHYTATIVLKDNRTIAVPPSMTAGSTIVLRSDMAGHRIVTVKAPKDDFRARGLLRIEATLSYRDDAAGLSFDDRFTFSSAAESSFFEFDYASSDRSSYSCTLLMVLANGLVQDRDLGSLSVDTLVLPSS